MKYQYGDKVDASVSKEEIRRIEFTSGDKPSIKRAMVVGAKIDTDKNAVWPWWEPDDILYILIDKSGQRFTARLNEITPVEEKK